MAPNTHARTHDSRRRLHREVHRQAIVAAPIAYPAGILPRRPIALAMRRPPNTHSDASPMLARRRKRRWVTNSSTAASEDVSAALDGEAHDTGTQRRGHEGNARQYDVHRHRLFRQRNDRGKNAMPRSARTTHAPRLTTADMRAASAAYMFFIIVSGFLSLTMSAIVSTTTTVLSFFHQCLTPRNSREISLVL